MSDPIAVPVTDLLLDEQNPRLAVTNQGQDSTIRAMAESQGNHLLALATDIVDHGLDPSDLFIVMKEGQQRYVVLDGNRRATALKALASPGLVKDVVPQNVSDALIRLRRRYRGKEIDSVFCNVVTDRTEANHWIEIKHTGYNRGAGPIPWGSDEGARFRQRTGGFVQIETQALDFLQQRGDIDEAFRSSVPTTTFGRLLSSPKVRAKLGVDWKNGGLVIAGEEGAVAKALHHVANDLAAKRITVRDLIRLDQRIKYAESLPADVAVSPPAQGQQRRQRRRRGRQPRDRLIPSDASLNVTDARLQSIEGELSKLSLKQYPNAVSVLFRVFLELSVDAYIDGAGLSVRPESKLGSKLNAATDDLVQKRRLPKQQAVGPRRAAQKDSFLGPSITEMHQYVHNRHLFPGPADLRADWDNLQPWFEAVWP